MSIRALLFDLDGTLLDTLQDIADSMNSALLAHGLPAHPLDDYRYFVGDGIKALAMRATGFREDMAPRVMQAYQANYEAGCRNKTRPYDGVPETLAALWQTKLPLCILSNKPHQDTWGVVASYFPGIPFAAVYGQQPHIPVKPDPAGALAIAKELGIAPEHFLYIGDTGVDMACANGAGMVPAGALWGFRPREELVAHGAKYLLDRPQDILKILAG